MRAARFLHAALLGLFPIVGGSVSSRALALPAATPVTAELLAAAEGEGAVNFYTSVDVEVAEKVKKAFEARYPRIKVAVERNGAQRQFQRLAQEYASRIFNADVVNSADAAHFVVWKRQGWLAPFVPEDVARHYAPEYVDPDGQFATWKASLCVVGYNTKFVKAAEAPRSYADLLDPKWRGLIVKAHPSYSGTILTETSVVARDLGWSFFERLAQQKVMQVQSSTESPKKLAVGERPVMADGTESNMFTLKEAGAPVEIVYPAEGTPLVPSPTAVLAKAPHPNAARLFQAYLYSPELQQLLIDEGGERSLHPLVKERPGRRPLATIKLLTEDPAAIADRAEEIKANYTKYFGT
jgi:iron(III) transport system substrate-binding protein